MSNYVWPSAIAGVVCGALGMVSGLLGFDYNTWQFWVITAPLCFLVGGVIGNNWVRR